jgi:hypothetical protein
MLKTTNNKIINTINLEEFKESSVASKYLKVYKNLI